MLVVAWCAIVLATTVTKASVLRFARSRGPANSSTTEETPNVEKLGTYKIKGLLQDLDQQTTATEDAEEIGSDLLSGRLVQELALKEEIGQEETQNLTDINSRATPAAVSPLLKDDSGTPGKTTAKESGESYVTGKPVWIESQDERFMFFPVTSDNSPL